MSLRGQGVTGESRGEVGGAIGEKVATRSPARQSRFHNFSFPTMNWGSQRLLRCVNPVSGIEGSAAGSTVPEAQIELQKKRQASYSPEARVFKEKETEQDEPSSAAAEEAAAALARPWNLRARRASCFAPSENGRNRYPKPLLGKDDPAKAGMLKSMVGENGKRRDFSVSLSREEIEEDFYAFKGTKPSRRPKKRAKIVQKQLDALFPGLWLSEVTTDDYKISKDKEVIRERLEELGGSAIATQRSPMGKSRLHNFSFPTMNWGRQRILRCVNSVSGIDSSAHRSMNLNTQMEPQQGINALYSPVDSHPMSSQVGRLKEKEEQKNASSVASKEAVETTIPWNLRKRRPTSDIATEKEKKHYCSSMPSKSLFGKDDPGKAVMQETTVDKNDRRRKFSISLSRKEIEEDFYIFTGRKPNPKPKKRPKAIQKQLDALFPGFWLSEVTKDMYKAE
ncbi:hypothetical protein IEQ34_020425 [Dendrobium chrysotoxum]|uniref:DUF1639 family protein n=1 Tax=Dendrobium chrysotoxum TaxID=161865 RepID=A0AAV7G2H1_DENCH|nr:hypothetical protein IEQ34_020425 [Dendrobium chrysotoxum]